MALYWLLILSLTSVVGLGKCYTSRNDYYFENEHHKYCDDLSPYFGEINLDQITGVWYGVEKIPHSKGEYKIERTRDCLYIDIREVYVEVCCCLFLVILYKVIILFIISNRQL